VVEQISKLGQDPKRLTAIFVEASKQRRTRLLELEAEGRGVEQELGRAQAVLQNLLQETDTSGPPQLGTPGQENRGTILQGYLENSNVSVVEELVALITSQRAYEVNSRVIKAADEMLQQTANLR